MIPFSKSCETGNHCACGGLDRGSSDYPCACECHGQPRCPKCGYTEADARVNMDHSICRKRGGGIPGYDDEAAS